MVLNISPSPKQSIPLSNCGMGVPPVPSLLCGMGGTPVRSLLCGMGGTPESVYSPSRRHTPPLSVNLMQPKGPIARKMLSKGFGK
ncbi:hypothetical protein QUB10_15570 [Microcoleus sp. B5-D4]|uniref:hypothetical protein n=1 Tax=unclassified Microcoleus TaxID=2642155 RepID=UPI002FD241A8